MQNVLDVDTAFDTDEVLIPDVDHLDVTACYVGERIDVREMSSAVGVGSAPELQRVGARGYAMVFRYGSVVLFATDAEETAGLLKDVRPFVSGAAETPEKEQALLVITPDAEETLRRKSASRLMDPSGIVLRAATRGRLQVVADVMGKSVALAHYDGKVGGVFDRIEPFATSMRGGRPMNGGSRELLKLLGDAAAAQTQTVGRVEIGDKPPAAWDRADLDRLFRRLSVEYELRERDSALTRKLDLISQTTRSYFDMELGRRTLRVEWYIVILIVAEIVLILYDIFVKG